MEAIGTAWALPLAALAGLLALGCLLFLRQARKAAAAGEARLEAAEAARGEAERGLGDARVEAGALRASRDNASALIDDLQARLAASEARASGAEEGRAEALRRFAALEERHRTEQEAQARLREEIAAHRAQLEHNFRSISQTILESQSKQTTEQQKGELEKLIGPFRTEISGLRTNLKEITEKAEGERRDLGRQIHEMQIKAAQLGQEANTLALALRGEKKRQGDWGETILSRILESAGMEAGTHYTRQATSVDEAGRRLIPDVVVHLPQGRDVIIDSKVTLVAYQDLMQASEKDAEAAALRRHVQAVRAHVKSLAGKSYDGLGFGSVDSVMMFLPVEGALSAACAEAPDLVIEAAEQRVHLITPSTLMPILKIVDHLWRVERRNKNVDEIVARAGRLHDKFASVVEAVEDVGRHLGKATESQQAAVSRMSEGPGNVIRQVDQLRRLGAKTRKTLQVDEAEAALEPPDE